MFSWGAVGKVPEHVLGNSIDTVRALYARKLSPFENLKIFSVVEKISVNLRRSNEWNKNVIRTIIETKVAELDFISYIVYIGDAREESQYFFLGEIKMEKIKMEIFI